MKNVKLILLASVFLLVINSCKKDKNTASSWSATVNGAGLNNAKQSGTPSATEASLFGTTVLTLTFDPSTATTPSISIIGTNTGAINTGTYTLDGTGIFTASYTLANNTQYTSIGGTLVITGISSSSNSVNGTFNILFTNDQSPYDSVTIAGGTFTDGSLAVQ